MIVGAQREAEFVVDVGDVPDHGLAGQAELFGDGGVAAALGHQRQHLALAGGEPAHGVKAAATGQHDRDDLGVEHRAAVGYPASVGAEAVHVRHPLLEQVADSTGPVLQQFFCITLLHIL